MLPLSAENIFTSTPAFLAGPLTPRAKALMNSQETAELLARVDERTTQTAKNVEDMNSKLDAHDARLGVVEIAIVGLNPVKKVVYAGIGLILTAVLVTFLGLILTREPVKVDSATIENAVNKAVQQNLAK